MIPSLALRLLPELRAYLDRQTITGDTIGDIRARCFVPWDSEWNSIVRDETAQRELASPRAINAVDPSAQPRERGPRATEDLDLSSSAGVAARCTCGDNFANPDPVDCPVHAAARPAPQDGQHLRILFEIDQSHPAPIRVAAFLRQYASMIRKNERWDIPETMASAYESSALALERYVEELAARPALARPQEVSDTISDTIGDIRRQCFVPPALARPAWQDIETAPKDGTEILGYQRGWCINGGEVNITAWSRLWEAWQINGADWQPTHWQALPPPPEPRNEEETVARGDTPGSPVDSLTAATNGRYVILGKTYDAAYLRQWPRCSCGHSKQMHVIGCRRCACGKFSDVLDECHYSAQKDIRK